VFVGDQDGKFHCIDAEKGTKRWTFDAGGSINSSANCIDEKVLFGSEDAHLYCLEAKTGKLLWKFHTDGPINCAPAIVEGRTFAAGCDPNLHIINIADGKEIGVVELGAQGDASAAISGDLLFFGNQNKNTVMAVDWRQKKLVWEFESEKQMPFHSSAAVADDLVIIGGRDKMVYGLEAKTGRKRWEFATRGKVNSSPAIAGGRVYIGSIDGNLYALDLRTGNKVWQHALGGRISASPAIGQGRLVIGTQDGIVYCLGAK
jgi:outer membrane protein assembly factor BamB